VSTLTAATTCASALKTSCEMRKRNYSRVYIKGLLMGSWNYNEIMLHKILNHSFTPTWTNSGTHGGDHVIIVSCVTEGRGAQIIPVLAPTLSYLLKLEICLTVRNPASKSWLDSDHSNRETSAGIGMICAPLPSVSHETIITWSPPCVPLFVHVGVKLWFRILCNMISL
jgi:hypothetical protein